LPRPGPGARPSSAPHASLLAGLCVEARYDEISYPAAPPLGVPSELHLVVGLVFIDGVAATNDRMAVDITSQGTVEFFAGPMDTNPDGSFEIDFTPAGGRELRLDVHACGNVPGRRRLNRVCQDAFVVRGLEVAPVQVTLAPGGTQQFTATLLGVPFPNVTWSASGGTINPTTGLFTAPLTPGTVTVTATNPTDGKSATATVTVGSTTTTTLPGGATDVSVRVECTSSVRHFLPTGGLTFEYAPSAVLVGPRLITTATASSGIKIIRQQDTGLIFGFSVTGHTQPGEDVTLPGDYTATFRFEEPAKGIKTEFTVRIEVRFEETIVIDGTAVDLTSVRILATVLSLRSRRCAERGQARRPHFF
jgi:hypothetical protein